MVTPSWFRVSGTSCRRSLLSCRTNKAQQISLAVGLRLPPRCQSVAGVLRPCFRWRKPRSRLGCARCAGRQRTRQRCSWRAPRTSRTEGAFCRRSQGKGRRLGRRSRPLRRSWSSRTWVLLPFRVDGMRCHRGLRSCDRLGSSLVASRLSRQPRRSSYLATHGKAVELVAGLDLCAVARDCAAALARILFWRGITANVRLPPLAEWVRPEASGSESP